LLFIPQPCFHQATTENEEQSAAIPPGRQSEDNQQFIQSKDTKDFSPQRSEAEPRPTSPFPCPPSPAVITHQELETSTEGVKQVPVEEVGGLGSLLATSESGVAPTSNPQPPAPSQEPELNQEGENEAQPPLDINHALQYLDAVKTQFELKPSV
jgi:histone deacetylase complex regulatory component SIN3